MDISSIEKMPSHINKTNVLEQIEQKIFAHPEYKNTLDPDLVSLATQHLLIDTHFDNNVLSGWMTLLLDLEENPYGNMILKSHGQLKMLLDQILSSNIISIQKEQKKEEKEQKKEEKEQKKEEKKEYTEQIFHELYNSLQDLKLHYPQYTKNINQNDVYALNALHIFAHTSFQTREQQKPILEYKYIIEQIHQEAQQKGFLTQQEAVQIEKYNTFCHNVSIHDTIPIDLPIRPSESLTSVRDLINNDNLGQTLYKKNENVQNFINNKISKQGKEITIEEQQKDIIKNLPDLFPDFMDKIINGINQISDQTIYNLEREQLIDEGKVHRQVLEKLVDENTIDKVDQFISNQTRQYAQEGSKLIEEQANLAIHQHTLGNCLQTVASYFDTVTLNMEDFAGDVKLDANKIHIHDDIVIMQGTIDGKALTISYNLTNGVITSQDFILANTGVVYVGDSTKQQETLTFRGPTYDEIQGKSTTYTRQSLSIHLGKGTFDDIDTSLRNGLSRKVPVKLDAVLGRQVMEHTIEKNLATKQIQHLLGLGLPSGQAWSANINPEIWQIYNIFDKTMDWYTPGELRRLRNLLTRMSSIITAISSKKENAQVSGVDPVWAFLFNSDKLSEDATGKKINDYSFYRFFSSMTKNKKDPYIDDVIDLRLLESVVDAYENREPFPKEQGKLSILYEWYDNSNTDPEDWLEEQLA